MQGQRRGDRLPLVRANDEVRRQVSPCDVGRTVDLSLDLLVVNHYRLAAEAGVYSVASQVAMMLMVLPGVIATLLFPRVTAARETSANLTCRVARHTTLVMLLVCLATVPASFLLPLLYGAAFKDVSAQLLILLPGVFLIGLESVLVQYFNAAGLPVAIPLFWVATLIINLALVFALVPDLWGARGGSGFDHQLHCDLYSRRAIFSRADAPHADRNFPP